MRYASVSAISANCLKAYQLVWTARPMVPAIARADNGSYTQGSQRLNNFNLVEYSSRIRAIWGTLPRSSGKP